MSSENEQFHPEVFAQQKTLEQAMRGDYFSVKKLKKIIENLDDDMLVCFHRVEDKYFEKKDNGGRAIKAHWEPRKISALDAEKFQDTLKSGKVDATQYSFTKLDDGKYLMKEYIDAIPAFQAMVGSVNGEEGESPRPKKDGASRLIFAG